MDDAEVERYVGIEVMRSNVFFVDIRRCSVNLVLELLLPNNSMSSWIKMVILVAKVCLYLLSQPGYFNQD